MIAIPLDIMTFLEKELIDSLGYENTYHLLYRIGKKQGYNGTEIYIKKFNINIDKKDYKFFLEQGELLGIGKLNIEKMNDEETIVTNDSIFCDVYKKEYGQQNHACCFYQLGLVGGAAEFLLNKKLNAIEKDCICSNSNVCRYVLKTCDMPIPIKDLRIDDCIKKVEEEYTVKDLTTKKIEAKNTETELYKFIKLHKKEQLFNITKRGVEILQSKVLITPALVFSYLFDIISSCAGEKGSEIIKKAGREFGKSTDHC